MVPGTKWYVTEWNSYITENGTALQSSTLQKKVITKHKKNKKLSTVLLYSILYCIVWGINNNVDSQNLFGYLYTLPSPQLSPLYIAGKIGEEHQFTAFTSFFTWYVGTAGNVCWTQMGGKNLQDEDKFTYRKHWTKNEEKLKSRYKCVRVDTLHCPSVAV